MWTSFDRLVYDEERRWTDSNIDMVALKHFPSIERQAALARPILYSNWLSKDYIPVDREELRSFTRARLKVWCDIFIDRLLKFSDIWRLCILFGPYCGCRRNFRVGFVSNGGWNFNIKRSVWKGVWLLNILAVKFVLRCVLLRILFRQR